MKRRAAIPGWKSRAKPKPGKPTPRSCWSCARSRIVGGLLECLEGYQGLPQAAARCRAFAIDPGPQAPRQAAEIALNGYAGLRERLEAASKAAGQGHDTGGLPDGF